MNRNRTLCLIVFSILVGLIGAYAVIKLGITDKQILRTCMYFTTACIIAFISISLALPSKDCPQCGERLTRLLSIKNNRFFNKANLKEHVFAAYICHKCKHSFSLKLKDLGSFER